MLINMEEKLELLQVRWQSQPNAYRKVCALVKSWSLSFNLTVFTLYIYGDMTCTERTNEKLVQEYLKLYFNYSALC